MKKITNINIFLLILILAQIQILSAKDKRIILEIYDIHPEQVIMKGFSLEKGMDIEVKANVGMIRESDYLLSTCWILNTEDRNLVWECEYGSGEKNYRRKILECNSKLNLTKGNYEVYYALNPSPDFKKKGFWGHVFKSYKNLYSPKWGVTIKVAEGKSAINYVDDHYPSKNEQTIIQLTDLYDDEIAKKGFSISKPLRIRIYAIGEGLRKERQMYDYGWIIDADTHERIWEMTYRNTDHAGGARKNRKYDNIVKLPTGNYVVYFVTDDSHSPQRWNQLPPYDPNHWGLTIWSEQTDWDDSWVKEYQHYEPEPIVEMTHIRNYEFEQDGFIIKRDTDLRIHALGEYSRSRRGFVDYGWIVDAQSREIFWEMDYYNTEHAGGGKKNRVFDDIVSFPAGSYLVYYISDDSHAYRDWNVRRPYDPEAWGITIYPADEDFSYDNFNSYSEDEDRNILAQIVRVRDDEHLIANFSIKKRSRIRIYAIGEGDNDEMYDYAWIEDEEGDTAWRMRYRDTNHAGGAKKNRLINDVITLARGSYLVHYKTDDSHSYRDWNASPPEDRVHWGVTVIKY